MNCKFCGKNFKPIRYNHAYCNKSCRSKAYNKSFGGVVLKMWYHMNERVNRNGRDICTKKEFTILANSSTDLLEIHTTWVKSKYLRRLAPSVDRINNKEGYLRSNIQFLALFENVSKGNTETKKFSISPQRVSVKAEKGSSIIHGTSMTDLATKLNTSKSAISQCANSSMKIFGWSVTKC